MKGKLIHGNIGNNYIRDALEPGGLQSPAPFCAPGWRESNADTMSVSVGQ